MFNHFFTALYLLVTRSSEHVRVARKAPCACHPAVTGMNRKLQCAPLLLSHTRHGSSACADSCVPCMTKTLQEDEAARHECRMGFRLEETRKGRLLATVFA